MVGSDARISLTKDPKDPSLVHVYPTVDVFTSLRVIEDYARFVRNVYPHEKIQILVHEKVDKETPYEVEMYSGLRRFLNRRCPEVVVDVSWPVRR